MDYIMSGSNKIFLKSIFWINLLISLVSSYVISRIMYSELVVVVVVVVAMVKLILKNAPFSSSSHCSVKP